MPTSHAARPARRHSPHPAPLAIASLMLGMTACAAAPTPARIIIDFRAPTEGAAPDLLARMQHQSGVAMRFSGSVSPHRHSYELRCPPRDARCETAIHKLREDPAVRDIVPDSPRATQPTPP